MLMLPASLAHPALLLITGVSILLMLIRPRGIAEVYWIGGGVLLLILLRVISFRLAAKAIGEGMDVYLFLAGMMLLSELAREHGVFDWVSSAAVQRAHGSRMRLFTLVYGVGTLVTILMSNDATAVVLTPAILSAVRKAKVKPLPYLFACALVANAASFALPISNPANLVVFHGSAMPPLGRWLFSFGVPSLLSIAMTYLVMRLIFRKELQGDFAAKIKAASLSAEGKLVLAGLVLMVAVLLIASGLKKDHWPTRVPCRAGGDGCGVPSHEEQSLGARKRDQLGHADSGWGPVHPGGCGGRDRGTAPDPTLACRCRKAGWPFGFTGRGLCGCGRQ